MLDSVLSNGFNLVTGGGACKCKSKWITIWFYGKTLKYMAADDE